MNPEVGKATTSELEAIAKSDILDAYVSKDYPRLTDAIEKYEKLAEYNMPSGAKFSKRARHWLMNNYGVF